ncbi:MAG: phage holin family protein [Calditrichaceae bacterium]|nr:phage holin family protein [Calditrichaceae bacterium]
MLRNWIIRILINAAALWVVDLIFDDVWINDSGSLILAAILFGILNTIIKPVLVVFTLPLNILTLGLFTLVINAIILELTDYWMDSITVDGFGVAILAALLISIVSVLLQSALKENKE